MNNENYAKASVLLSQLSLRELECLQEDIDRRIEAFKIDTSDTLEDNKYYSLNGSETEYYYAYSEGFIFISLEEEERPWVNSEEGIPTGNYKEVSDIDLLQKFKQLLEKYIKHQLEMGEEQISTWKERIKKMEVLKQTLG